MPAKQELFFSNDPAQDAAFQQPVEHRLVDHTCKTNDGRIVPIDGRGDHVLGSTEVAEALRRAAENYEATDSESSDVEDDPLTYHAYRTIAGKLSIDVRRESKVEPRTITNVQDIIAESINYQLLTNKNKTVQPRYPKDYTKPFGFDLDEMAKETVSDDLAAMGVERKSKSARRASKQRISASARRPADTQDAEMVNAVDNAEKLDADNDERVPTPKSLAVEPPSPRSLPPLDLDID